MRSIQRVVAPTSATGDAGNAGRHIVESTGEGRSLVTGKSSTGGPAPSGIFARSEMPLGISDLRRQGQVADGIRTRDHRDHNPGLYQLSYRHRERRQDSGAARVEPK